jgi:hypothetical protein
MQLVAIDYAKECHPERRRCARIAFTMKLGGDRRPDNRAGETVSHFASAAEDPSG